MQHAMLRDVANGTYLTGEPIPFQRIPTVGETIWLVNYTVVVMAVNHTWDASGSVALPVVLLDVGVATAQQGSPPDVVGSPM